MALDVAIKFIVNHVNSRCDSLIVCIEFLIVFLLFFDLGLSHNSYNNYNLKMHVTAYPVIIATTLHKIRV